MINETDKTKIADFIMLETSTLGIRVRSVERIEAERTIERFLASVGEIGVKLKKKDGVVVGVSPEYEDCKEIAEINGLSLQEVFLIVQRQFSEK